MVLKKLPKLMNIDLISILIANGFDICEVFSFCVRCLAFAMGTLVRYLWPARGPYTWSRPPDSWPRTCTRRNAWPTATECSAGSCTGLAWWHWPPKGRAADHRPSARWALAADRPWTPRRRSSSACPRPNPPGRRTVLCSAALQEERSGETG